MKKAFMCSLQQSRTILLALKYILTAKNYLKGLIRSQQKTKRQTELNSGRGLSSKVKFATKNAIYTSGCASRMIY